MKLNKLNKNSIIEPKIKAVELWKQTHGHISDICTVLGISRTTFYTWLNSDPEFAQTLQDAEGELNDEIREALIQKCAEGDMTAITFYLRKRHPDFKDIKMQPATFIQQNFAEHIKQEMKRFEE